jgi:hypothetical protein
MADFAKRASTKTQATLKIMKWHYRGDETTPSLPLSAFETGNVDLEVISPGRPFKAVIFTVFPWLMVPLQQVNRVFKPLLPHPYA